MTYTCSCGDSYTETIPATGQHVIQEVPHYAIKHYLPPQYVCNDCQTPFPDEASVGAHIGDPNTPCCHGYSVSDYILDWVEDCGTNPAAGSEMIGWYEVCNQCGQTINSYSY